MPWNDGLWNGNRYFQACQKCDKRFPGCHGVCELYAADKAAYKEIQESMKQVKDVDAFIRYANRRINVFYGSKRKEKMQ